MPFLDRLQIAARRVEEFLYRYGWLLVVLTAICYYAQYYRSGLNVGGEGGTVAIVAMRLLEGQRPIVDTALNYNLMWFFPVTWLFDVTGPNYIALRLYFFGLCTVTGVMSFFIARRVSGRGWFAMLAALGPVFIPGMLFRNYMGFLTVLNMLCLLQAYVFEQPTRKRQFIWMIAAGAALGLTYLVRIDLGAFFTVITIGLLVLFPLGKSGEFKSRLKTAGVGLLLTILLFLTTHAPFYIDASRRGYADVFVHQYSGWIGLIRHQATEEIKKSAEPPKTAIKPAAPKPAAKPVESIEKPPTDFDRENYLQKSSVGMIFDAPLLADKIFAALLYLPVLFAAIIVLPASILLLIALVRSDFALRTDALAVLIAIGSALTLFPQYFFFRPDTPHLSEFMVPFMVAMACIGWIFAKWALKTPRVWFYSGPLILIFIATGWLYYSHAMPKESAGTIAAASKRRYELVAENGVKVLLKRQEHEEFTKLYEVIRDHTKPDDWLVCYPYSPTVNFMTNRRSYEHDFYIDNAFNISEFYRDTMREIQKYRPAAIIIDNRAINQTEASRFRNWAQRTYDWIRANYTHAGTFRRQEVYFRPDLYSTKSNVDNSSQSNP